jgi:hypothetical protein
MDRCKFICLMTLISAAFLLRPSFAAVEMLSINTDAEFGGIRIEWTAASEINNDRFEIMRGTSPQDDFTRIGVLRSQGSSPIQYVYRFLDENVIAGNSYYYYLADVSVNGERSEHHDLLRSVTAISTPVPTSYSLDIFPNPFNPTTTIYFTLKEAAHVQLLVYDVTGRFVETLADKRYDSGAHHLTFDAAALPAGIYFARFESPFFHQTRKMVLLK